MDGGCEISSAFHEGAAHASYPGRTGEGHADRFLPIAPDFALFLLETPEAARVMPAQLKELMRHESIETTLRYYVADQRRAVLGLFGLP